MKKYKIYAAGRFVDTSGELEVRRPYDGKLLASTGLADPALLYEVIVKAAHSMEDLRSMPSHQRSRVLEKIADGMFEERNLLAEVLCQEAGKPLKYALGEVDRAIQVFRVSAEEAKRLPAEYVPIDWTAPGEGKEGWLKYYPIGLIGAISPFNFPLNLSAHKLAPAIATGNPIILKPASQTPLTVLELARIIDECGLPEGVVSVLPMTRETGSLLVTDPRVRLLSFTGSPEVGWKMKEQSGRKKVVLELGGNAGAIVTETADIPTAVKKCISGAFAYSGQVCIHLQRIYVTENHFDNFVSRFIEGTHKLKSGDPLDPATDLSVMIDEPNACRVEQWIGEAVQGGAVILWGGQRDGSYIYPTVMTQTQAGMKVLDLEVFGPVVCIEKIKTFGEGIARINESKFGLQAGVFTNRIDEMNMAFDRLEVGGVIINDVPTFRVDHMPYGGVKESGFGREGVRYAMMDMLEPRLLIKNK